MHSFYLVDSLSTSSSSSISSQTTISTIGNSSNSSSSSNCSNKKIDDTIVNQFNNQVGGHSAILSIQSKICKPLINREHQFYEFTNLKNNYHSFLISPFIANYFGKIEILKQQSNIQNVNNNNNNNNNNNSNNNQYISGTVKNNNNNNNNQQKNSKHQVGTKQNYLLLEDLTASYNKPCIVDIKVGTRSRGTVCSSTTSTSLGIRVCGMKIFNPQLGNHTIYDRYYGRSLNPTTFEEALYNFFIGNNLNDIDLPHIYQKLYLLDNIIEKLNHLYVLLSNNNDPFPFKIYSSSLLIIYEGQIDDLSISDTTVRDSNSNNNNNNNSSPMYIQSISSSSSSSSSFASSSSFTGSSLSSSISTPSNSPSTPYSNFKSSNNISFVNNNNNNINNNNNASSSASCEDTDSIESDEEMDDSAVSSDLDSDSECEKSFESKVNHHLLNSSNTTTLLKQIKHDVKMIDFAHAIPKNEPDAIEDDGYTYGISNLIMILLNIKTKLQSTSTIKLSSSNSNNN